MHKKVINRYWLIMVLEIFLMLFATIMDKHHTLLILFTLGMVLLVLITIEICFELKFLRMASVIFGTIASVCWLIWMIPSLPTSYAYLTLTMSCSLFAMFFAIAIVAIGKHVFNSNRASGNTIIGSICIYLLIGITFAFIYNVTSISLGGIFYVDGGPMQTGIKVGTVGFKEFLYFSFSTLATIGYGDIVPKDSLTRMTSYIEGILGSLYLAIVVAKLVGMYVTQNRPSISNH